MNSDFSRYDQFYKALDNFKEALALEVKTARDEAGMVKLFELVFELSWKCMKKYLEEKHGVLTKSPRNVINEAYRNDLITEENIWLKILESRNTSSHTYETEGMGLLRKDFARYLIEFECLSEKFKS